jgi:uncharacterized membrane protein (UPF0127 family)
MAGRGPLRMTNVSRGTVVATSVQVADSFLGRLVGLLGRRSLRPGHGLLISPSSSIHTFFMLFPIDVAFLDRQGRVVRMAEAVAPFRVLLGGPGAWQVLELPAGALAASATSPGDLLRLEEAT